MVAAQVFPLAGYPRKKRKVGCVCGKKMRPKMIEWNLDRFVMDEETRNRLKTAYPAFDSELPKIEMWYLANPRKRKKDLHRFLVNWMNRVKEPPKPVFNKYQIHNEEFKKKMEDIKECDPPPPEWAELKKRLKGY